MESRVLNSQVPEGGPLAADATPAPGCRNAPQPALSRVRLSHGQVYLELFLVVETCPRAWRITPTGMF